MRLDVKTMKGEDYSYVLYDVDTNTTINDCAWADDETGEYGIYDRYTEEEMVERYGAFTPPVPEKGKLVPKISTLKFDEAGKIIILPKKGNIKFRKWDAANG